MSEIKLHNHAPGIAVVRGNDGSVTHVSGDKVFYYAHDGTSMNPTLSNKDMLEVVPYRERPVKVGDVIFFHIYGEKNYIVHRVVRIERERIITRGDNSGSADSWKLSAEDIQGQVVAAWRGQKRRKIIGGKKGLLFSYMARCRLVLDKKISWFLHPLYRFLADSGIFQRLLPHRLGPRVVTFKTDGLIHQRVLIGKRVVGYYAEKHGEWNIKRPFRLFVDESILTNKTNLTNSTSRTSKTN